MSTEESKTKNTGEAALQKYRKGMKALGRSLILLAILQLVIGAAVLAISRGELIVVIVAIAAVLGFMGAVHLTLGILLRRNYYWANYLVAAWGCLLMAGMFLQIGMQAGQGDSKANPGSCLGLLIAGAMLHYSFGNLSARRQARAAGLEP